MLSAPVDFSTVCCHVLAADAFTRKQFCVIFVQAKTLVKAFISGVRTD